MSCSARNYRITIYVYFIRISVDVNIDFDISCRDRYLTQFNGGRADGRCCVPNFIKLLPVHPNERCKTVSYQFSSNYMNFVCLHRKRVSQKLVIKARHRLFRWLLSVVTWLFWATEWRANANCRSNNFIYLFFVFCSLQGLDDNITGSCRKIQVIISVVFQ